MPRTVDHDERRSTILEAFVAVAVREGLHAVSMRSVAVEAGISLRLVQYYFESKAGLMQAGLTMLEKLSNERWEKRSAALPEPPTATEILKALFVEALPTDRQGRDFHLLWMSYAVLGMTDAEIPNRVFVEGPNRLLQRIVSLLKQGQVAGELDAELNADNEAAILLGLVHGLSTAVIIGLQSGETALKLLTLHLDRLKRSKV
ncbi:TetR family transcriptional regulator C-terminal domain-containing protein [Chelatococcus daeguensis]|uniref:TetR/AcrR family transcriptional regulator n=1 Tax=Chelatococcus daeguensis TaxID=444444 RepID=UPI0007AB5807|nr:TetR family transcriptional regulator C-terminal domain-containing protein [Chelatococcus daeguensis]KZE34493.1 TetR family transcriptional regulator [Chelatococcus daeguensis]MBM3083045.1 TetR family transcriptional regulator C-terminal domain-containing protein [Chelatococcus daeguensis]